MLFTLCQRNTRDEADEVAEASVAAGIGTNKAAKSAELPYGFAEKFGDSSEDPAATKTRALATTRWVRIHRGPRRSLHRRR